MKIPKISIFFLTCLLPACSSIDEDRLLIYVASLAKGNVADKTIHLIAIDESSNDVEKPFIDDLLYALDERGFSMATTKEESNLVIEVEYSNFVSRKELLRADSYSNRSFGPGRDTLHLKISGYDYELYDSSKRKSDALLWRIHVAAFDIQNDFEKSNQLLFDTAMSYWGINFTGNLYVPVE